MRTRGSALITALFVMCIVSIAAVALSLRIRVDIDRTKQVMSASQLLLLEDGARAWAQHYLQNDDAVLPVNSPEFAIDQYKLSIHLESAEARFNLNDLVTQPNSDGSFAMNAPATVFAKLIRVIDPTISETQSNTIALNAMKYIWQKRKSDDVNAVRFASISELRVVPGVSAQLFTQLSPYVSAPPGITMVNYHSVSAAVLASLYSQMTLEAAQQIVQQRNANQFHSLDEFSHAITNTMPNSEAGIALSDKSRYFLMETSVKNAQQSLRVYRVLLRSDVEDKKIFTTFFSLVGF